MLQLGECGQLAVRRLQVYLDAILLLRLLVLHGTPRVMCFPRAALGEPQFARSSVFELHTGWRESHIGCAGFSSAGDML